MPHSDMAKHEHPLGPAMQFIGKGTQWEGAGVHGTTHFIRPPSGHMSRDDPAGHDPPAGTELHAGQHAGCTQVCPVGHGMAPH
jgi:hypothetical protein